MLCSVIAGFCNSCTNTLLNSINKVMVLGTQTTGLQACLEGGAAALEVEHCWIAGALGLGPYCTRGGGSNAEAERNWVVEA